MEVVRYWRVNRQGYNLKGYVGSDGIKYFGIPHPRSEDRLAGGGPGIPSPVDDNSIIEVTQASNPFSSEASLKMESSMSSK